MDHVFVLGMAWVFLVCLPPEIQPGGFVVIPLVPMAFVGFLVTFGSAWKWVMDSYRFGVRGAHGAGSCSLPV